MVDTGMLFTKALALSTLAGNMFVLSLFFAFVFMRPVYKKIMNVLSRHALTFGFFLATASTMGSIVYSEVVGFPACILCWIQRIFMYPQMFLFGLAHFRRDRGVFPYTLLLTVLGGAVALYQWAKDMLALYTHVTIPCPAVTLLPSCDKIYVFEYGYITIPMIALNAFILIGIVMYAARTNDHG
jgi:disulfide bond formation protein DsbB